MIARWSQVEGEAALGCRGAACTEGGSASTSMQSTGSYGGAAGFPCGERGASRTTAMTCLASPAAVPTQIRGDALVQMGRPTRYPNYPTDPWQWRTTRQSYAAISSSTQHSAIVRNTQQPYHALSNSPTMKGSTREPRDTASGGVAELGGAELANSTGVPVRDRHKQLSKVSPKAN